MDDIALDTTRSIRETVAEILGVSSDAVDPEADLVEQGLDSLRIMSLAGRWRRQGVAVDFAALTAAPTVSAWARLVSSGRRAPGAPVIAPRALHHGFFARAAAAPAAVALIGPDGEQSYAELRTQALAVAGALGVAGVRPGDRVAVLGPAGPDTVTALLGILAAGAVYVPIAATEPTEQSAQLLTRAGVRMALFAGDEHPSWLPALTVAEALRVGAWAHDVDAAQPDPDHEAYLVLGTAVTHAEAVDAVDELNRHLGISTEDRIAAAPGRETELSVLAAVAALTAGAALVVADYPRAKSVSAALDTAAAS
ncbi:AMP-binding protein [Mycolicibacterium sp. XJ870]